MTPEVLAILTGLALVFYLWCMGAEVLLEWLHDRRTRKRQQRALKLHVQRMYPTDPLVKPDPREPFRDPPDDTEERRRLQ